MAKMIQCKGCGKLYYSNMKMCPECHTKTPVQPQKIVTIVLICFAALVVIGAIGSALSDEPSGSSSGDNKSTPAAANSTVSNENKETTVNIGGSLDANGLKIEFQKAEDWESNNMFVTPESGNKFIRAYFVFTNNSKSDKYVGSFDFKCYADNAQAKETIFGDDQLSYGNISSGRSLKGYVYYEVPVNANSIEIEYETNWWTDKKAIFKIK